MKKFKMIALVLVIALAAGTAIFAQHRLPHRDTTTVEFDSQLTYTVNVTYNLRTTRNTQLSNFYDFDIWLWYEDDSTDNKIHRVEIPRRTITFNRTAYNGSFSVDFPPKFTEEHEPLKVLYHTVQPWERDN